MGKEKETENIVHGNKRAGFQITYDGVYDLDELLRAITEWFSQWVYDVAPEEHSEKVGGDGKELKIIIKAFRKVTEYVKFVVDVEIVILREVDVVVDYKGKNLKQQKGEVQVRVKTMMQKNWMKTFSDKQEFLRQTYEKYIMKKTLSNYEDKLRLEGDSLIRLIKEHFAQYHW